MAYNNNNNSSNYNYNFNRHNSIGGNWHLPPPPPPPTQLTSSGAYHHHQQQQHPQQHLSPNHPNGQDILSSSDSQFLSQLKQNQIPGFRNPWFSQQQNSTPNMLSSSSSASSSLSQSPTKSHQIPLLQQHQPPLLNKRLSFTNNLPITYEHESSSNSSSNNNSSSSNGNNNNNDNNTNVPPYIHPPTRADNPFNHYFATQEVTLGSNDRRMSAAVDGTHYNPYGFNQQLNAYPSGPAGIAGTQYLNNPNLGPLVNANRRSSVGVLPNYYRQQQQQQQVQDQSTAAAAAAAAAAAYYLPPARLGRSALIVQYQQYQQALQNQRITKHKNPAPKARKIYNKLDLTPKFHQQPKYRRCSINSIHISPVNALSIYLTESYSLCQPRKFQYSKSTNPKRVLTKPLEPKYNNGYDNEDSDYILYVNDVLGSEEGKKYMVLDLLGSGTFGQVVKCQNLNNQTVCAVKVIKSKPAYMNQSLTEVRLLEFLNANSDGKNFIRLLDTFMHKEHLCLVFEILASNLYELIKQNQFQGLNMKLVKLLTKQLLDSMAQLKNFQMIHCDLKPENILLCQPDKPNIKVIDFGSACFTRNTIYTYIQSRFYRSPEVILGLPYTESIDMWSLGCIVGELFLGLPMFPGTSEYNQIFKIVDMLGPPPRHMIEVGKNSFNFFKKKVNTTTINNNDNNNNNTSETKPIYELKSFDEYCQFLEYKRQKQEGATSTTNNNTNSSSSSSNHHHNNYKKEQPNKNYFKHKLLKDIIINYKLPSKKMTNSMIEKEYHDRLLLIDFLTKVLNLNPLERLTPQEALKHPFIIDVNTTDL